MTWVKWVARPILSVPLQSTKLVHIWRVTIVTVGAVRLVVLGTYGVLTALWSLRSKFAFVILKWPLKGHPRSRSLRIPSQILGINFLLVFLSNYWSISDRLHTTDPQPFRYNRMTTTTMIGWRPSCKRGRLKNWPTTSTDYTSSHSNVQNVNTSSSTKFARNVLRKYFISF